MELNLHNPDCMFIRQWAEEKVGDRLKGLAVGNPDPAKDAQLTWRNRGEIAAFNALIELLTPKE